jgi:S-(hydroxymethyl)glutathione dehydrogenase/alcohol dehydrogenase
MAIQARAALLWEQPGKWQVQDVEIPEHPGPHEVLVEMVSSGLCHSDDHVTTGDLPVGHFPYCGGHEGSGIIREVGPDVRELEVGDHIVTSFIPACGTCKWCAAGNSNLCDYGAVVLAGTQIDGTFRMKTQDGADVARFSGLGTFANWEILDEVSVVKIRDDVPLSVACLVACGVPTGFGSAHDVAGVKTGDVVIVMGSGGIGINAVQGAALAGASHVIVADPQPLKREVALKVGATEAFASIDEAANFARSITDGQGADAAIVTVGVITGDHIASAFSAVAKTGTLVVTALGNIAEIGIPVSLFELAMFQKRIQGVLYGNSSPRAAIPRLLDLYAAGRLHLDELITTRYPLEQINQGYEDMHAGKNIRGVIDFEH